MDGDAGEVDAVDGEYALLFTIDRRAMGAAFGEPLDERVDRDCEPRAFGGAAFRRT